MLGIFLSQYGTNFRDICVLIQYIPGNGGFCLVHTLLCTYLYIVVFYWLLVYLYCNKWQEQERKRGFIMN